ncbi:MAG TPA: GntR family transcriptional regulator [Streptosporangiaceae bacterium]|nr:GntR family transcriptional regulator [Streptosporangiaceae bacterium]
MLERDAPYVQIIEHYRRQIAAGRLKDGDMLPSGREIAAEFGVSIATAAKVATGLQALGLVTARPGAGTVVTAPRPPADRAQGGPIIITLAARSPARTGEDSQLIEAGLVQAPQEIARQLGTEPLGQVIRRRQATTRNGETAAILTSWFPAHLKDACPALLDASLSDDRLGGYEPAWGEDWLSARPPTSAEAREFSIKRGSPVLIAHSRRFDAADTVVEYAELIARADTRVEYRYEFK